MHQFTHRYGDYSMRREGSLDTELPRIPSARLADPDYVIQPRYWVPEWQVVKKTANVPGALLQALEADSEKIWQVLATWFAGYHLRRGVETAGVELLLRSSGLYSSRDSKLLPTGWRQKLGRAMAARRKRF